MAGIIEVQTSYAPVRMFGYDRNREPQVIDAVRPLVEMMANASGGLPPLRSKFIAVVRGPPEDRPMYVANTPSELIRITAEQNLPYKFIYQLAHEMVHLLCRSDLRWEKPLRHNWIEEALCGAGSVYCMRAFSHIPQFSTGASSYISEYIDQTYSSLRPINSDWFKEHATELLATTTLTDTLKPLSGLIASELEPSEFLRDNALLRTIDLCELGAYLQNWRAACGRDRSVPALLQERLGITEG